MSWTKRLILAGILAVTPVNVILCYQGFQSAANAGATPEAQPAPAGEGSKEDQAPRTWAKRPECPAAPATETVPAPPAPDAVTPAPAILPAKYAEGRPVPTTAGVPAPCEPPPPLPTAVVAEKKPDVDNPPAPAAPKESPPNDKKDGPTPPPAAPTPEPKSNLPEPPAPAAPTPSPEPKDGKPPEPPAPATAEPLKMEPKRGETVPDPLTATAPPAPKEGTKQENPLPSAPVPVVPAGPGAAPAKENWVRPPAPTPEAPPRPEPVSCPWTFDLAILDGKTVLTAKAGDAVQFKITCERLELQAPRGNIQAIGDIVLSSSGLKGTSQRLTISLQEDRVYLDGQARVICEREGQELDVQGERLSLRLRASGSAERQARHEHMKE